MSVSKRMQALETSNTILVNSISSLISEINSIQAPGQIANAISINVAIDGDDSVADPLEAGNNTPFATASGALAWVNEFILRAEVEILIGDGTYSDNIVYSGLEGSRITIKALNAPVLTDAYNPPNLGRLSADHIAIVSPMFNVVIVPPTDTVGIDIKTGSELSIGGIHVDCVTNNSKGAVETTGAKVTFIDDMLCTGAVGNGFLFTRSEAIQGDTGVVILSVGGNDADIRFNDNSKGMFLTSDVVVLNGINGGLVADNNSNVTLKDGLFISSLENDIGADNNSNITLTNINIDKDGDGTGNPNIGIKNSSNVITNNIEVNAISFGSVLCANKSGFMAETAVFNGVVGYALEALRHSTIVIEQTISISETGAGNGNSNGAIATDSSGIYFPVGGDIDVTANALEANGNSSIRSEAIITNGDIFAENGSDILTRSHPNTNNPVIGTIGNNNAQIIPIV